MGWIFEGPFHQTHLRDARLCMKMFELKYRYGAPPETRSLAMVNGSAMHKAIERMHVEGLFDLADGFKALYLAAFAEAEAREDIPIRWDKGKDEDLERLSGDACEILQRYNLKGMNRQAEVLLSEACFTVQIGGYAFAGILDQYRRQGDAKILIDFKSGKTKPMDLTLRLGTQFSVYTHAIVHGEFLGTGKGHKRVPVSLPDQVVHYQLYDHLPYKKTGKWGNKGQERGPAWYPTERTEHDLKASEQEIRRICGNIRRGTFPRAENDMICRMCRFQEACLQDYLHGGLDEKLARKLRITLSEEDE
ncbi:MAG: PD-(D/E)XK nuclease family protein [Candidatus Binatia bacterium]